LGLPNKVRILLIIVAVIGSDQLTKIWVMKAFQLYESREIIPGLFNLTYLTNKGAAFGFLAGVEGVWRHWFFLGVAAVALVVLIYAFVRLRRAHGLYGPALALIAGGAVGNLIDRIRLGSVVDFLDFYIASHHWPAFNLADSAITVGVGLFILANILEEKAKRRATA
jgi:signal peptidase II